MSEASRLLVVDDEHSLCVLIRKLLEGEPYSLQIAHCGEEAIRCLDEASSFDMVLLDLNLPDMDGFKVMRHVGKVSPDTLVVIMTGYASLESATEALRHGAHDYLTKPFAREELTKALQNALIHKRTKDAHRRAELDLKDSELCFRNLVENILSGILIARDGELLYQNLVQKEAFGSITEAVLTRDYRHVHPEDKEKVKEIVGRFLSNESPTVETDYRFHVPGEVDGREWRWALSRASRISYRGKPAVLFNTVDVSRLKELERIITKNGVDSPGERS